MIVDCHTHVFPPEVIAHRERYVSQDDTFAALYSDSKARLATAKDLIESMQAAGIDASVMLGFAWQEEAACRMHNDYLLQQARDNHGRLVAFCTLPLAAGDDAIQDEMRRCVSAGARGFGELRPDDLAFDLAGGPGDRLAAIARELDTVLLFHVTEPVGHTYPGKQGLDLATFYRFIAAHPDLPVIGAHWGGGLPFYASMPEIRHALSTNVHVDTAASSLLYDDAVYERGSAMAGPSRVLFGSDYPLLGQKRSLRRIRESGLDPESQSLVCGDNAARLLGLR